MDLTGWLLRVAAAHPHVFVAAVPGQTRARLAAEAEIGRRGWPTADSPADADLLVVAGHPGPQLAAVVETLWGQMPAPRARVTVTANADVAAALDAAAGELADADAQRRDPEPEPAAPSVTEAHGDLDHETEPTRAYVSEADDPTDHDSSGAHGMSGDHEMSGDDGHGGHHEHHGHGEGMEMPGGIPMADLGEDRDGLMLDAVHVPLGPLLPDWPAGLVLRVVLQGDVIREAEVEVLDPPDSAASFWSEPARRAAEGARVTVGEVARRAAAGHLDGLARFLAVAGWADPAARARRLRDALLAGEPPAEIALDTRHLARRVGRSRTLRWLVRGTPAGGDDDVAGRLTARLSALGAALDALEDPSSNDGADPAVLRRFVLDRAVTAPGELAAALVGAEFAAARLVVAALDPVPDAFTSAREAPTREAGRHRGPD